MLKKTSTLVLFSATLSIFTLSCSASKSGGASSGTIRHIVLCWLKEPGNADARRKLIDASYELKSIPGVISVHAGTALPSDRPIVDDSFDVGVVFVLKDAEALQAYLVNPIHKQAVATILQPLTERIVIYDIVE